MQKKSANSAYRVVIDKESNNLYSTLYPYREKRSKLNKGFWVWVEGTLMPTRHANKISRQKDAIEKEISSAVNAFYKAVEKSVNACIDSAVGYNAYVASTQEIVPKSEDVEKKATKNIGTASQNARTSPNSDKVDLKSPTTNADKTTKTISGAKKRTTSTSNANSISSSKINMLSEINAICDENDYEIKGTTLIKYIGAHTDIKIPDSVKTIAPCAFKNCSKLTSIEIPDSVTAINGTYSDSPFYGCTSLKKVVLGKGISVIGAGLFRGLPIEEIEIPFDVNIIGEDAFEGCYKLKKITIPETADTIYGTYGNSPFRGCSSLKSINLKGTDEEKIAKIRERLIKLNGIFETIISIED